MTAAANLTVRGPEAVNVGNALPPATGQVLTAINSTSAKWQTLTPVSGTMTGFLAPAVVSLPFSTAINVNAALGNVFTITLTASTATIQTPTNPVDGQVIRFRVIQGPSGGWTVAWTTAYDWGSTAGTPNSAPTLSTGAALTDILGFEYNAALSKWMYLSAAFPQGF